MANIDNRPIFTTGVAASIIDVRPKTLINYDTAGIVDVQRSKSKRRRFSRRDLFDVLIARELIKSRNLTFEGAKIVLEMIRKAKDDQVDLIPYVIQDEKLEKFKDTVSI